MTLSSIEAQVFELIRVGRVNQNLVPMPCRLQIDSFLCSSAFPRCSQDLPILACSTMCQSFWSNCQTIMDLYLSLVLAHDVTLSSSPSCVGGTFSPPYDQPVDVYGGRVIPNYFPWPGGYFNQTRYPDIAGVYSYPNGTIISIPCHPSTASSSLISMAVTCEFPFVVGDVNGTLQCVVPCPFPLYSTSELSSVQWAFAIPALIGGFLCILVLLDSCWQFVSITQGSWAHLFANSSSAQNSSSAASPPGSPTRSPRKMIGGPKFAAPHVTRNFGRVPVSTYYALVGSVFGIAYMIVAAVPILIKKQNVSCNAQGSFVQYADIRAGSGDQSDFLCKMQRTSPFIVMEVFNLILFSMYRVYLVVSGLKKRFTGGQAMLVEIFTIFYCFGWPIVCLGVCLALDKLTTSILDVNQQLARQSSVCWPRLDITVEVIFIFLPFIITGIMICVLSLFIFSLLRKHSNQMRSIIAADDVRAEGTSGGHANRSMELLMRRLAVLGLASFVLLIVFMVSTSSFQSALAIFSPLFTAYFLCKTTSNSCVDCESTKDAFVETIPPVVTPAVQLAALSCVPVVFATFFLSQSVSRLIREYRDGTLVKKWNALVSLIDKTLMVGSSNIAAGNTAASSKGDVTIVPASQRHMTEMSRVDDNGGA